MLFVEPQYLCNVLISNNCKLFDVKYQHLKAFIPGQCEWLNTELIKHLSGLSAPAMKKFFLFFGLKEIRILSSSSRLRGARRRNRGAR